MNKNKTIFIRLSNPNFHEVVRDLLSSEWEMEQNYVDSFLNDTKESPSSENPDKKSKFNQFIHNLKETDLIVCLENNYVDKVFRDSYYHYYASKASAISRDCIKMSFFLDSEREMQEGYFLDYSLHNIIKEKYKGFAILRPTIPNIIGRSAISPDIILGGENFVSCKVKIKSSISGFKCETDAFPYSSQDGEIMTCAETSIWAIMEYYGNKYPEYTPLLPSKIIDLMKLSSAERQLPSKGLTGLSISYIVKCCGLGPRLYQQSYFDDLKNILGCYVESGIPIIVSLSNANTLHPIPRPPKSTVNQAVLCVGREKLTKEHIDDAVAKKSQQLDCGQKLIDFDDIYKRYVFIDDNFPPYQLDYLDTPVTRYSNDKKWEGCIIDHFIAPLHNKIYLEPHRVKIYIRKLLSTKYFSHLRDNLITLRTFLCSARSFRNYVNTSEMSEGMKRQIGNVYMPKFVWVVELSTPDLLKQNKATGIILIDATECTLYNYKPLIVAFSQGIVVHKISGTLNTGEIEMHDFEMFNNLY